MTPNKQTTKIGKRTSSSSSSSKAEVKRLKAENEELRHEVKELRTRLDLILEKLNSLTPSTTTPSLELTATTPASSTITTPPHNTYAPSPPATDSIMEVDQQRLPPLNLDTGGILAKRHITLDAINREAAKRSKKGTEATPGPTQPPTTTKTPNRSTNSQGATPRKQPSPGTNTGRTGSSKTTPAIIAENVDVKSLAADFKAQLGHGEFLFQTVNSKRKRILVKTKESRTAILKILKDKNIDSFSHTPHDERSTTVLLKKVCSTYDKEDVCAALKEEFPTIEFSRVEKFEVPPRFKKNNPDRYTQVNIWQLTVPPGANVHAILKTTTLGYINQVVAFQTYHTDDVPFCRNCKEWEHTKSNCQKPWRCSRCTETHAQGECKVPTLELDVSGAQKEETLPTCRNCGKKGHPASYRCVAYNKVKKHKEASKKKQQASTTNKATFVSSYTQKGVSYSSQLSPPTVTHPATHRSKPAQPQPTVTAAADPSPDDSESSPCITFEYMQKLFKMAQNLKPRLDRLKTYDDKQCLIGCSVLNLVLGNGRKQ